MKTSIVTGLICRLVLFAVLVAPSVTVAGGLPAVGDYLGKNHAEIAQRLKAKGYEINELETERGFLEVEITLEGVAYEMHIDPKSGRVVSIEEDD